jgi:hypothetical protein
MFEDDGVLTAFRTEGVPPDHILDIVVTEFLLPPVGECVYTQPNIRVYRDGEVQIRYEGAVENGLDGAYMRIAREGNYSAVQVKRQAIRDRITAKLVLNALEAEHQIVRRGGFLLHSSYICCHGKAILFTAPSGTGKSTQADLWCQLRGARLLNGDRAAVMKEADGVVVRGVPFAGSSGVLENESFPLVAIVYLSQAPKTRITSLTGVRAFRSVWEGCSVNVWDSKDLSDCTESVLHLIQKIPVYHLACTPDVSAVEALEQKLW